MFSAILLMFCTCKCKSRDRYKAAMHGPDCKLPQKNVQTWKIVQRSLLNNYEKLC